MARRHSAQAVNPPSDWDSLKEQLLQFVAIIGVAAIVAFLGITVVEWKKRQSLPFCDSYSDTTGSCIPCPDHGKCWEGILECFPGFKRHGKSCVRDKQLGRSVQVIADLILEQVCGIYSLSLCKGSRTAWLTINEITQLLKQAGIDRRLGLDAAQFALAQDKAITAVQDKIIIKTNLNGMQELQCPIELLESYKPFWCRAREWIYSNYMSVLIFVPLVLFMVNLLGRTYYRRKVSTRAEQLYLQVCEALEEKATNKNLEGETWVVASRLRDHLLKPSERNYSSTWRQVEQMVQGDSRIDQYPKLIKGESKVVWEWQVEGALRSPSLKKIIRLRT